MIDKSHAHYKILPPQVSQLQETINASFEHFVPLTFRYLYATRAFDFIGVFQKEADQERMMELIRLYVEKENIHTLKIGSCFGEIGYDETLDDVKEVVHKMWGKAIIVAVKNS